MRVMHQRGEGMQSNSMQRQPQAAGRRGKEEGQTIKLRLMPRPPGE
jgi:hypothetical protein